MEEVSANQAACPPTPRLIKNGKRRQLPGPDESSAPPATPILIKVPRGMQTKLKGFTDTIMCTGGRLDTVQRHSRASLFAPRGSAGDMGGSYFEDAEEPSEMTEFCVREEPASHQSLKEMLTKISMVDLGKQLMNAQLTDSYDEFSSILRTFENAQAHAKANSVQYDTYLTNMRQAFQAYEAAKQCELPDHLKTFTTRVRQSKKKTM